MSDREIRELKRRCASGDESAWDELRLAWWRMGEPSCEGPWQFGPQCPKIAKKPTPETRIRDVLSCRAQSVLNRMCGTYGLLKLDDVARRATRRDLRFQKLCGPKTIAEIENVLALAGLKLAEERDDGVYVHRRCDYLDGRGVRCPRPQEGGRFCAEHERPTAVRGPDDETVRGINRALSREIRP